MAAVAKHTASLLYTNPHAVTIARPLFRPNSMYAVFPPYFSPSKFQLLTCQHIARRPWSLHANHRHSQNNNLGWVSSASPPLRPYISTELRFHGYAHQHHRQNCTRFRGGIMSTFTYTYAALYDQRYPIQQQRTKTHTHTHICKPKATMCILKLSQSKMSHTMAMIKLARRRFLRMASAIRKRIGELGCT